MSKSQMLVGGPGGVDNRHFHKCMFFRGEYQRVFDGPATESPGPPGKDGIFIIRTENRLNNDSLSNVIAKGDPCK